VLPPAQLSGTELVEPRVTAAEAARAWLRSAAGRADALPPAAATIDMDSVRAVAQTTALPRTDFILVSSTFPVAPR
jgi:hypothetical protein